MKTSILSGCIYPSAPNCENQRFTSQFQPISSTLRPSHGIMYVPPHYRYLRPVVAASPDQSNPASVSSCNGGASSYAVHDGNGGLLKHEHHQCGAACNIVPGVLADNVDEWKCKLYMLLQSEEREVISREKKDRRNYQQIAYLANMLGLHSNVYAKVVVVSKDPLPNYRFDLDDKRPQREVILSLGLENKAASHLKTYLSERSRNMSNSRDVSFSRPTCDSSIATCNGILEQPESVPTGNPFLEKVLQQRSLQLCFQQRAWQDSHDGQKILEFRACLPAYKEKDRLLAAISHNQVTIISGETGCGKTTQIPQIILESEIKSLRGSLCSIICTQPRRISAISVSERVAAERGEKLGESVGYKVRLEGLKGSETHLLFCTTGILLRRLLIDRNLKGVSHIVIDEIHERGVNEDFLLVVLKDLLVLRPELRIILMSATLDTELFSSYFNGAPIIQIPGSTFPVRTHFLEDILESTGYQLTPYNQIDDYGQERMWKVGKPTQGKRRSKIAALVEEALKGADFKEYSLHTRASLFNWDPDIIGFNLIEHVLCHIHEKERPGAILVFMTGWDDINSLKEKLQSHLILGDPSKVLLITCHGSMGSSEQRLIFHVPEDGMRKIVLATNITETSITINDVVFVVDCGKAKETSYDALNNTPCLLASWISKVSCQQRRGRAGRTQSGECYNLYPKCVYDAFPDFQLPEILRTPLQSLCLQIKSLKLGGIFQFLSRALQSPEFLAVQNAIDFLKVIGALDERENLTHLGQYLTMLPVEPKLGRMLIFAATFGCLNHVLTIVAGLSVRDPFLSPFDKRDLAEAAKARFSPDNSDHLAIVRAYNGWKEAEKTLSGQQYCWENFLSLHSMRSIDALRNEFITSLQDAGFVSNCLAADSNMYSDDLHLVRSVICSGLYPGICSVVHNERSLSLKTIDDGQVFLSLSSVNARDPKISYPWLIFNGKMKVNAVFLRDTTAISDTMLILFGGTISKGDHDGHLKMLDGFVEFFMSPTLAGTYQALKRELEELIQMKLLNPKMDMAIFKELLRAVRLLISGDQCVGKFVYNRSLPKFSTPSAILKPPALASRTESGPGGDNSKSQLQTLLSRSGYGPPTYDAKVLGDGQFVATVEFSGMQITGRPCGNKKSAEKDAAAEALESLMGGTLTSTRNVDQVPTMLKRSKKNHNS